MAITKFRASALRSDNATAFRGTTAKPDTNIVASQTICRCTGTKANMPGNPFFNVCQLTDQGVHLVKQ